MDGGGLLKIRLSVCLFGWLIEWIGWFFFVFIWLNSTQQQNNANDVGGVCVYVLIWKYDDVMSRTTTTNQNTLWEFTEQRLYVIL